jgi:hypothetical protein
MNDWIGKDLEVIGRLLTEVLTRNLSEGTEEIYKNTSVRIVGVLAKIRRENRANSSPEYYSYKANLSNPQNYQDLNPTL